MPRPPHVQRLHPVPSCRNRRAARYFVLLLIAPVLAACSADAAVDGYGEETLPGGVVRVRNPDPERPDGKVITATEQFRIGMADGDAAYVFGGVRDLLVGGDGRVYVLDTQAREVRIFDAAGTHLRTVGRSGAGPGEFQDPRGMRWHPDGSLWVMDYRNQRYTALSADGELIATHPRRVPASGAGWAGSFDADGRLFDTASLPGGADGGQRNVLIAYELRSDGLAAVDTFALPATRPDVYFVNFTGGILQIPVPFAPVPGWAFDQADAVWLATGDRYELVKRSLAGDTLRLVEVARAAVPVSAAERASAEDEIAATLTSLGADPAQVDLSRIPANRPAHGRIRVDDQGRLWVAHALEAGANAGDRSPPTRFDVFSDRGILLGTVTLDIGANSPVAFGARRVAGVRRDELGVQQVVVYEVDL